MFILWYRLQNRFFFFSLNLRDIQIWKSANLQGFFSLSSRSHTKNVDCFTVCSQGTIFGFVDWLLLVILFYQLEGNINLNTLQYSCNLSIASFLSWHTITVCLAIINYILINILFLYIAYLVYSSVNLNYFFSFCAGTMEIWQCHNLLFEIENSG